MFPIDSLQNINNQKQPWSLINPETGQEREGKLKTNGNLRVIPEVDENQQGTTVGTHNSWNGSTMRTNNQANKQWTAEKCVMNRKNNLIKFWNFVHQNNNQLLYGFVSDDFKGTGMKET